MRALLFLPLLAAPAFAGDPAPARYKPFYEVAFAEGADPIAASKVLKALKAVHGDYPGLVTPQLLKKILFLPNGFGNAKYCWNPDSGIVNSSDEGCVGEHLTIAADPELVGSFEGRYGDFYKEGLATQAVVFHELLHGWAWTHPKDLEAYSREVSDGRRTMFERKHHRLMKPIWALERQLEAARRRVQMGEDTREQWKARGGSEFEQALLDDAWTRYHDGMTLPQAVASVDKYEKKLEEVGARIGARVARYNARKVVPGRGDRDIHATENDQEWWAYGGEIYFFSRKPEDYLTAKELAWWKAFEPELKGGSRAPTVAGDSRRR